MTDSGHLTTQEVSYDYSWSEADRAGCPYCGGNSYYLKAARYKDDELEGYECPAPCKREFSEKELTNWITFLNNVVDGCREDPIWGLHSLAISLPPFHIDRIARDRMDYLDGKKTLAQIADPAHCRDDLMRRDLLGMEESSYLQRYSETLSMSLTSAHSKQTATKMLKGYSRKRLEKLRDEGPASLNLVRAAEVAGVTRQTIPNWIKEAKVKPINRADGDRRVDTVSLVNYLLGE